MTPTWNMDLLETAGENFDINCMTIRVPSRQTIHNLLIKLRTTRLLIDNEQKHKRQVLTEEKWDIWARLEHTPSKSLKRLVQETGVSKSSARTAT
jgi:gamma-glutamylcysteine synthetase